MPVPLPSGVTISEKDRVLTVKGPKGSLDLRLPDPITVELADAEAAIRRPDDEPRSKERHGLVRALINNMVKGVSEGYEIKMELYGTGYTCNVKGDKLLLNCGYMGRGHGKEAQFFVPIPAGLTVEVVTPAARGDTEPAKFTVKGIDKQQVGQFCAEVRKIRKPEPYKGKGIRYHGEHIVRKAGKVFAGGG